MAYEGYPLVGDELYGGPPADALCLHAWRLELDGRTVECAPPAWAAAQ
jgi:23S rRNA-/tRNA-specific pseudouridylate synthase